MLTEDDPENEVAISEDRVILFIRSVPLDVKREFKSYCDLKGSDMSKELVFYMKTIVERERRLRGKL